MRRKNGNFSPWPSERKRTPDASRILVGMQEFEADLRRIARLSKMLAFGFWSAALIAACGFGYVLLVWLPHHYP